MGITLRHSPILIEEAMRFVMVLGCACALIGAGRFIPF
jgi:hypothetical protein